jgi:hypothetical protein
MFQATTTIFEGSNFFAAYSPTSHPPHLYIQTFPFGPEEEK